MSELLPCPFCNSRDLHGIESAGRCRIECGKCSAIGPFAIGDSSELRRRGAERLWNMRSMRLWELGDGPERQRDEHEGGGP